MLAVILADRSLARPGVRIPVGAVVLPLPAFATLAGGGPAALGVLEEAAGVTLPKGVDHPKAAPLFELALGEDPPCPVYEGL